VNTPPDVIARGDLRPASTARPAARGRLLKPVFLAAASLLSLTGFALIAAALAGQNIAHDDFREIEVRMEEAYISLVHRQAGRAAQ